jgi:hypothetical protein
MIHTLFHSMAFPLYLEPIPKFDRIIALFPLLNCDLHPEEGEDKGEK